MKKYKTLVFSLLFTPLHSTPLHSTLYMRHFNMYKKRITTLSYLIIFSFVTSSCTPEKFNPGLQEIYSSRELTNEKIILNTCNEPWPWPLALLSSIGFAREGKIDFNRNNKFIKKEDKYCVTYSHNSNANKFEVECVDIILHEEKDYIVIAKHNLPNIKTLIFSSQKKCIETIRNKIINESYKPINEPDV